MTSRFTTFHPRHRIQHHVTLEWKLYEANVIVKKVFGHAQIAISPQFLTLEARIAADICSGMQKKRNFPPVFDTREPDRRRGEGCFGHQKMAAIHTVS